MMGRILPNTRLAALLRTMRSLSRVAATLRSWTLTGTMSSSMSGGKNFDKTGCCGDGQRRLLLDMAQLVAKGRPRWSRRGGITTEELWAGRLLLNPKTPDDCWRPDSPALC